jgi:predicted metal-dependent hydrolase
MKQLDLFGSLMRTLLPQRKPKIAQRPFPPVSKPAVPKILDVEVGGRTISVHVYRKKSARNYILSISRDGSSLRLTLPPRGSLASGLEFVREKQLLISKWQQGANQRLKIIPGATIPFKGTPHLIVWQADFPRIIDLHDCKIRVGGPRELVGKRVLRWLKEQALADLTRITVDVATKHKIRVLKISVNNATARWGSCSSTGQINYSWRLILAPDAARHYVVCHELAHLKHMNHSPKFWAEVERLGGDLSQKAWFKGDGITVMAI